MTCRTSVLSHFGHFTCLCSSCSWKVCLSVKVFLHCLHSYSYVGMFASSSSQLPVPWASPGPSQVLAHGTAKTTSLSVTDLRRGERRRSSSQVHRASLGPRGRIGQHLPDRGLAVGARQRGARRGTLTATTVFRRRAEKEHP